MLMIKTDYHEVNILNHKYIKILKINLIYSLKISFVYKKKFDSNS